MNIAVNKHTLPENIKTNDIGYEIIGLNTDLTGGWAPKFTLVTNSIQEISSITLPHKGVWMIMWKMQIVNLSDENATLTFRNIYISNTDENSTGMIDSYNTEQTTIMEKGHAISLKGSNIYVATDELNLKMYSTLLIDGELSMTKVYPDMKNEYNLKAIRIA